MHRRPPAEGRAADDADPVDVAVAESGALAVAVMLAVADELCVDVAVAAGVCVAADDADPVDVAVAESDALAVAVMLAVADELCVDVAVDVCADVTVTAGV